MSDSRPQTMQSRRLSTQHEAASGDKPQLVRKLSGQALVDAAASAALTRKPSGQGLSELATTPRTRALASGTSQNSSTVRRPSVSSIDGESSPPILPNGPEYQRRQSFGMRRSSVSAQPQDDSDFKRPPSSKPPIPPADSVRLAPPPSRGGNSNSLPRTLSSSGDLSAMGEDGDGPSRLSRHKSLNGPPLSRKTSFSTKDSMGGSSQRAQPSPPVDGPVQRRPSFGSSGLPQKAAGSPGDKIAEDVKSTPRPPTQGSGRPTSGRSRLNTDKYGGMMAVYP